MKNRIERIDCRLDASTQECVLGFSHTCKIEEKKFRASLKRPATEEELTLAVFAIASAQTALSDARFKLAEAAALKAIKGCAPLLERIYKLIEETQTEATKRYREMSRRRYELLKRREEKQQKNRKERDLITSKEE